MKIYRLMTMILALIAFNSCNDCPLEPAEPVELCNSRIVTMERFNPNFTVTPGTDPDKPVVTLDPDYSISMYQFPDNASSSGTFPNDTRFQNSMTVAVAQEPFGTGYTASLVSGIPANEDMLGDILVASVDVSTTPATAMLRFAGKLALFGNGFLTENSQAFCDYVTANRDNIIDRFSSLSSLSALYGSNVPGAVIVNLQNQPIVVSDAAGKLIGTVGQPNVPDPPQSVINSLKDAAAKKLAVEVKVEPGQVFCYIARNGKRFVFFVSEIRQTTVDPYRKRVTIMFYTLD